MNAGLSFFFFFLLLKNENVRIRNGVSTVVKVEVPGLIEKYVWNPMVEKSTQTHCNVEILMLLNYKQSCLVKFVLEIRCWNIAVLKCRHFPKVIKYIF